MRCQAMTNALEKDRRVPVQCLLNAEPRHEFHQGSAHGAIITWSDNQPRIVPREPSWASR